MPADLQAVCFFRPSFDLHAIEQATEQGLTGGEAKIRLAKYGPNKLPHKKRNPVLQYLGYMWNPLSWVRSIDLVFRLISSIVSMWERLFMQW